MAKPRTHPREGEAPAEPYNAKTLMAVHHGQAANAPREGEAPSEPNNAKTLMAVHHGQTANAPPGG
ncbi:MAG: hypothetical protein ACK5OB_02170 [Pirellula sp.]